MAGRPGAAGWLRQRLFFLIRPRPFARQPHAPLVKVPSGRTPSPVVGPGKQPRLNCVAMHGLVFLQLLPRVSWRLRNAVACWVGLSETGAVPWHSRCVQRDSASTGASVGHDSTANRAQHSRNWNDRQNAVAVAEGVNCGSLPLRT